MQPPRAFLRGKGFHVRHDFLDGHNGSVTPPDKMARHDYSPIDHCRAVFCSELVVEAAEWKGAGCVDGWVGDGLCDAAWEWHAWVG